jgi:hypothetical protein
MKLKRVHYLVAVSSAFVGVGCAERADDNNVPALDHGKVKPRHWYSGGTNGTDSNGNACYTADLCDPTYEQVCICLSPGPEGCLDNYCEYQPGWSCPNGSSYTPDCYGS